MSLFVKVYKINLQDQDGWDSLKEISVQQWTASEKKE